MTAESARWELTDRCDVSSVDVQTERFSAQTQIERQRSFRWPSGEKTRSTCRACCPTITQTDAVYRTKAFFIIGA